MTNDERNPKPECRRTFGCAIAGFVIRILVFLRISSFVIRISEQRFMESPLGVATVHRDHAPMRFGPRAVPARSGRAKTRAWVISQGCWRGPHAATGDRSRSATSLRPTHGPTAGPWKALTALTASIWTI